LPCGRRPVHLTTSVAPCQALFSKFFQIRFSRSLCRCEHLKKLLKTSCFSPLCTGACRTRQPDNLTTAAAKKQEQISSSDTFQQIQQIFSRYSEELLSSMTKTCRQKSSGEFFTIISKMQPFFRINVIFISTLPQSRFVNLVKNKFLTFQRAFFRV